MKTMLHTSLLCSTLLLLSGCVQMSIEDTVRTDMRVERSMIIDFSQATDLLDSLEGLSEFIDESEYAPSEINIREICEQIRMQHNDNETEEWISFQCAEESENSLKITGLFTPTTPGILTQERLPSGGTLYRYIITASEGGGLLSSSDFEESMLEYTLIMPGSITSAEGGAIIQNNAVYFTMNNFDGEDIVIESTNESHRQRLREKSAPRQYQEVTTRIQEDESEMEKSTLSTREQRVCDRLGRFANRPKLLERVQERIERRFNITCSE